MQCLLDSLEDYFGLLADTPKLSSMSLPPPQPHRAEIEHLIRRAIYNRLGRTPPKHVQAPNPLLVNISARHCHLTPQAVEALFG
jgi:putative phosphotransacetylase